MIIRTRADARVGIIGNPSDGFFGKTIAATIANFHASVTLWESPTLRILPHPVHDPAEFASLEALRETAIQNGYYGGMRLIFAACKRFSQHCAARGHVLPDRCFTIAYDTDIPRQVGLAGSSAIVTAAVNALMRFYAVPEEVLPRTQRPNLVLDVEMQELAIAAGLQDRVVQTYGGCVHMDFDRALMDRRGHGEYTPLDPSLLPLMYLAWDSHPSDSGRIHSDVRTRFLRGDQQVIDAMQALAQLTDQGLAALNAGRYTDMGRLMSAGFDIRRSVYGDAAIGDRNLAMVAAARQLGFSASFPGSGGAVVGVVPEGSSIADLAPECERIGYQLEEIRWAAACPASPNAAHAADGADAGRSIS
ncbi:MAG: hypothetical protein NT029_17210 [Armatimonadetes bacterium]|nr:hypothetical protein [Armatimonadota bacterium]